MKFKIKRLDRNKHTDIVSCVGWTNSGELFSVSDDQTMLKWDINGEPESKIMDIDVPVMDMDWLPSGKGTNEVVAIACSDGSFKLVSKAGRVEKNITEAEKVSSNAHRFFEGKRSTLLNQVARLNTQGQASNQFLS